MAQIMMSLKMESEFFGKEKISVKFNNIPEPITSDDLAHLFYRFSLACGYSEQCTGESMVGVGGEMLPPEKKIYDPE